MSINQSRSMFHIIVSLSMLLTGLSIETDIIIVVVMIVELTSVLQYQHASSRIQRRVILASRLRWNDLSFFTLSRSYTSYSYNGTDSAQQGWQVQALYTTSRLFKGYDDCYYILCDWCVCPCDYVCMSDVVMFIKVAHSGSLFSLDLVSD